MGSSWRVLFFSSFFSRGQAWFNGTSSASAASESLKKELSIDQSRPLSTRQRRIKHRFRLGDSFTTRKHLSFPITLMLLLDTCRYLPIAHNEALQHNNGTCCKTTYVVAVNGAPGQPCFSCGSSKLPATYCLLIRRLYYTGVYWCPKLTLRQRYEACSDTTSKIRSLFQAERLNQTVAVVTLTL